MTTAGDRFAHLIDGALVDAAQDFAVINPATGAPFARCPAASADDVGRAVAAAARAFRSDWATDDAARRAALARIGDVLMAEADAIGRLICREQGRPLTQAIAEVFGAAQIFGLYAHQPLPIDVLRDDGSARVTLVRRPLGVTAAITPWNYPLATLAMKVAPALLVGNTVVAKPSPYTPLSSLATAAALRTVLPPGVLNVIGGDDAVGAALCAHPRVRRISVTGSIPTGKAILRSAADDLKRVTLELGGNDPAIVLRDVDPAVAAPKIFWNAFANAGQICMAIKRVYVHEDVYAPLRDAIAALARGVKVGDGFDPESDMGPVNNRRQFERVIALVDDARRAGGKAITGGAPLPGGGYFYPPTILADVSDGVRVVDEEQFGPVLPLIPFRDVDDAVARANRGHYGLGASVWTADVERGEAVARRLDCGTAWVNQHMELSHEAPFGGTKWSGLGRENGRWGVDEFCDLQVINVSRG